MYKISKSANASKLALASKTALATILLGFLFVGWGGASLQAQERKTGWFVGISPYAMDLNLKKTTRQTTTQTTNFSSTGGAIIYDATVPNFALDDTHLSQFYTVTEISLEDRLAVAIAAREDAIQLCRAALEGAFPVITLVGPSYHYPDLPLALSQLRHVLNRQLKASLFQTPKESIT